MKPILLTAALALLAAPALADTAWTRTGPNGGTAQGSVDCARLAGALTCTQSGQYTGPIGRTATRAGTRVITGDSAIGTFTVTGPRGRSRTTTWVRNR